MAVSPQSGHSAATPPRGHRPNTLRALPREVPPWQRWAVLALALLLLHFSQRFEWPGTAPPVWYPSAGLALVVIAWYGRRGVVLVAADLLLAVAVRWAITGNGGRAAGDALVLGLLQLGALTLGWYAYHHLLRASRVLGDPRSMVLFLVLLPGLSIGLFAALRDLTPVLWLDQPVFRPEATASWWIAQALGLIALAPPLLCGVTPWLVRRGLLTSERLVDPKSPHARLTPLRRPTPANFGPVPLTTGEWIEISILSLCTGAITLLLLLGRKDLPPGGWQVWGVPLLLIVWAGLRQGLRAATIVIAVGSVIPLETGALIPAEVFPALKSPLDFLGNLLAHCAALLVASSVSWMRFSESRYRQVAAQIPVVLYSARLLPVDDSDGVLLRAEVTFVSPPCLGILGATPPELLGDYERWLDRVHPDDRELVLAAVFQLQRNSQPVTCEYRLAPAKDESERPHHRPRERWLRETLVPHLNHEGQLEGWEGMVLDISEQRTLADDLRRTTSMFHTLVSNLPAGVFYVQGPHAQPVLVNARARELLGQRENPSIDFNHFVEFYRLHKPDGTPYPLEELPVTIALRHGASSMREDIVVHRVDGRRVPLVTWAAPILVGHSKTADAAVWVLEDLTALRQAEAARRESEVRLRGMIDALGEGVLVQNHEGKLLDCNAAAGKILGRPLAGLVGHKLPEDLLRFVRTDGTPLDEAPGVQVLRTRRPVRNLMVSFDRRLDDTRQEKRWVLLNALPLVLVANTPPAGVVMSLVDLTDLIQAQERAATMGEELQRAQRLELVGRLSSGIAHDFNNLLTSILGLTDLVRSTLGPDHEAAGDVERIAEVGRQASNLAQQILDYSKQRKVPLRPVEFTRVWRRTLDVLRGLMPAEVRLSASWAEGDVTVHADEMQLQQVLLNLCLNARDAIPGAGLVEVRAERIGDKVDLHYPQLGAEQAAREWLRISVHDSGVGMDEATQAQIFEPFFTTKDRGTGLGLAVVKQIVEQFGGRVRVASEPGLGSRFEVWLPLLLNPGEAI